MYNLKNIIKGKEKKDQKIIICLTEKEKEAFQKWCNENGISISRVIQNFIKDVIG